MKLINKIWNMIWLEYYKVDYEKNLKIDGRIIIQGKGTYRIGKNVHIISDENINPVGGNRTVLQTLDGGKILIGNNVGLSHAIICARECISIEDNVLLGGGAKIYDNDFHPICYSDRIKNNDNEIRSGGILIKEGAFIGAHSIILKGVIIGKHSIIGAGSVVASSVPDNEIWAGNPARLIRKLNE